MDDDHGSALVSDMGFALDKLMDYAHDAGAPPPRWGRMPGTHKHWAQLQLPGGTIERHGESRDDAARAVLGEIIGEPKPDAVEKQAA